MSESAPILARHPGTCPECHNPIRANEDAIVEVDGKWVHEECAPYDGERKDADG